MADVKLHWAQAEHNRGLMLALSSCTPIVYRDWVVIVGFYAAVHYVEARLATEPEGHSDGRAGAHRFRLDMVSKYYGNSAIKAYRKLYRTSLILRYLVAYDPSTQTTRCAAEAAGAWLDDYVVRTSFLKAVDTIKTETQASLDGLI